jgi:hypothetical protein
LTQRMGFRRSLVPIQPRGHRKAWRDDESQHLLATPTILQYHTRSTTAGPWFSPAPCTLHDMANGLTPAPDLWHSQRGNTHDRNAHDQKTDYFHRRPGNRRGSFDDLDRLFVVTDSLLAAYAEIATDSDTEAEEEQWLRVISVEMLLDRAWLSGSR